MPSNSSATPVLLARNAMATRFEIVLHGNDPVALRAAGEEALDEIERIEGKLSLYQPTSEIAKVNARAGREPVRVSLEVFALLQHAKRLSETTDTAFDISVGPLMRCWGLCGETGRVPDAQELARARGQVGMHRVRLDAEGVSVRFESPGMMLDLGAIGKGYAIDRAVEILREAGITSAFLHGGTSAAYGLGVPPDAEAWKVSIDWPQPLAGNVEDLAIRTNSGRSDAERETLAIFDLADEALSVSAPSGKSFRIGEKTYGHVIDPRCGQPVTGAVIAAVALPSATNSDALSTALLTLGIRGHDTIAAAYPAARMLAGESQDPATELRVCAKGVSVKNSPRLLLTP